MSSNLLDRGMIISANNFSENSSKVQSKLMKERLNMRICKVCGTQCDSQASFCPQCGHRLDSEDTSPSISTEKEPTISSSSLSDNPISQQQISLSYFWYKLMYLLGGVALSGTILPWMSEFETKARILWSLSFLIIFSALSYFAVLHHNYLAGIAKGEDYHKLGGYYEQKFGKKLKLITAVSIVIGVVMFLVSLPNANGDIWDAVQIGLILGLLCLPLLCVIWTFRVSGFVIIAAILVGLGGFSSRWTASQASDRNLQNVENSMTNQMTPSPVVILGATLSEYAGKEVLVVSYKWTNHGQEDAMPISEISVTAFQGGVELEEAIFYNTGDDVSFSEIKPGTTVELETAFYLRTHEDVEFEIVPAFDYISGNVYASSVFHLED